MEIGVPVDPLRNVDSRVLLSFCSRPRVPGGRTLYSGRPVNAKEGGDTDHDSRVVLPRDDRNKNSGNVIRHESESCDNRESDVRGKRPPGSRRHPSLWDSSPGTQSRPEVETGSVVHWYPLRRIGNTGDYELFGSNEELGYFRGSLLFQDFPSPRPPPSEPRLLRGVFSGLLRVHGSSVLSNPRRDGTYRSGGWTWLVRCGMHCGSPRIV